MPDQKNHNQFFTSTQFYREDGRAKEYAIEGDPLFTDDEGSVYQVYGRHGVALKVLNNQVRTEFALDRLKSLIFSHIDDQTKTLISWPIDIVRQNNGFAGFVMTYMINGTPINEIYNESSSVSRNMRVRIAKNLCICIDVVHSEGIICGDLSPARILVNPFSCRVFLKDGIVLSDHARSTDRIAEQSALADVPPDYGDGFADLSSQLHLYSRLAWVSEFLAPEVGQRGGFRSSTSKAFTFDTDNYALAVNIFALFMDGIHPYDYVLHGNHVIENLAIERPQSSNAQPLNIPGSLPRFSLIDRTYPIYCYRRTFTHLPSEMRQCVYLAFRTGLAEPQLRPDAKSWFNALDAMANTLRSRAARATDRMNYPYHSSDVASGNNQSDLLGRYSAPVPAPGNISKTSNFLKVMIIFSVAYIVAIVLGGTDLISSLLYPLLSRFESLGYAIMGCAGAVFGFGLYALLTWRKNARNGYQMKDYLLAAVSIAVFSFVVPFIFHFIINEAVA